MEIHVVQPHHELLTPLAHIESMPDLIELAGRTCYKSETKGDSRAFVRGLIRSGHESVIEHCSITVLIVGDRSMSHQLVRHRIAAYSQESQRYCNYHNLGFSVIVPPSIERDPELFGHWHGAVEAALTDYEVMIMKGIKPEDARSLLPNAIKTEVVTTFNLRQWRHVFKHRALNHRAQWQIQGIMVGILEEFAALLPCVFGDLLEA